MSFLPTLLPWQWALLAAVPIGILLLYFLKLRRQPLTVPSTYLWAKTVEDLHVNSLLQRLRATPLLLLQLLAVALAASALIRPGYRDESRSQSRRILLLDASASMQATDVEGERSRFEAAQQLIGTEIDAMTDQDVAMLITFSDRADVMQSFTSDRRKLRNALSTTRVTNRSTEVLSALRTAAGLSSDRRTSATGDAETEAESSVTSSPTELVLYSDGGFQPPTEIDLSGLNARFVPIGSNQINNLAIVAFSAQRSEMRSGDVEAFVTVANLGTVKAASSVSLRMNGELVDADQVELEPGEEVGLSFQLADDEIVRLMFSLDQPDDLAVDNQAYASLAPARTVSVLLVTPGNDPLELALSTGQAEKLCVLEVVEPGYLQTEPYQLRAQLGADELIIFDRCQPPTMPLANTLFIGAKPPDWQWSELTNPLLLVDIDRSHPIMRYLDLFSLLIAEGRTLTPPPGAMDLLIAEAGPVLSLAPRNGFEDLVLGFDILSTTADGGMAYNTDWQVQRSWPVFVYNAVRYLTGAADLTGRISYAPGSTVAIATDYRQGELSIRTPEGSVNFVKSDQTGRVAYPVGDGLGNYEVEDENRVIELFSVNLFDRRESQLVTPEAIQLGYRQIEAEQVPSRREYWRLLLLVMLGILTIEWWYYGRRLA